jgi:putative oxidoreductase
MMTPTMSPTRADGNAMLWRERVASLIHLLERTPQAVLQLLLRLGVAAVFWRSGMLKLESFEFTVFLFRDEYRVPLLPPELAAYLATAAELVTPVMLVLGLGARLAALTLLGMAFVIQVFVYPSSWPEHLMWAAILAYILARGPGPISLDHLLRRRLLGAER